MPRSIPSLLQDILLYSERCREITNGKSYLAYVNDERLRMATERCISVVGEALRQAAQQDESIYNWFPDAVRIVGLRHRLVHGYYEIHDVLILSVTQDYLLPLEDEARSALREYGRSTMKGQDK